MAVWDSFAAENKTMVMEQIVKNKRFSDALLILLAGGAALLSYSLVYSLRKPYTAASFEVFDFFGTDYKVAVTTIQILGYVIAKFFGIKLISELKKERRFKFFVCSAVAAEAALVGFGLLAPPFNVAAMFLNGLSLGCMSFSYTHIRAHATPAHLVCRLLLKKTTLPVLTVNLS